MIPRAGLRPVVLPAILLGFLVLAPPNARGAEGGVDTILRREESATPNASEEPASSVALVHPMPRGAYAAHLDAIVSGEEARAGDAIAQALGDSTAGGEAIAAERREKQPDVVLPVLGGLVGGAAGLYGGAFLGYVVTQDDDGELGLEEFGGLVTGAALGEIVGASLGAHLGNARKGSFAKTLLVATVTGIAGWGLVFATESGGVAALAGAVHLGLVVATERKEGARRIAERAAGGDRGP